MTAVAFTVYGQAAPAGSKKGFQHPRTGRVVVMDASARARPWKAQVTDAAAEAMEGRPLLDSALAVTFRFVLPRPKGHYGARGLRPAAPTHPTVKPDVLKLARAVEDALTGVVYRDDSQIIAELLVKEYGEPARVEITVAAATVPAALTWNAARAATEEKGDAA